jgi:hypothetical protein
MIDIIVVHGDAGDLPSLNAVQGVLGRKVNLTSLTLIFSFEPTLRVLPTHMSRQWFCKRKSRAVEVGSWSREHMSEAEEKAN